MCEYLYRFQECHYANDVNEFGDSIPGTGRTQVHLTKFKILRTTRCGAWIYDWSDRKRFVNLKARKQYASISLGEAMKSWRARKVRHLSILNARIRDVKQALIAADCLQSKGLEKVQPTFVVQPYED